MENSEVVFDTTTFTRTATLFTRKRKVFTPETVEALAGDVLRRLANGGQRRDVREPPAITETSMAAFCEALIQSDPEIALRFIEERRAEGLTRMGVYLGYVCSAARRLGEGWENDTLSFVDVTTGTGHLYALMRAMRGERAAPFVGRDAKRAALFATVPGENHGIGVTVASDVFRERGWDIDLQIGKDHESLVERVERTRPHIVGVSLSTEDRFDALVRLVMAIRLAVPDAIIGVAPREGLDRQKVRDLVDMDLLFDGAVGACAQLEEMIGLRD